MLHLDTYNNYPWFCDIQRIITTFKLNIEQVQVLKGHIENEEL